MKRLLTIIPLVFLLCFTFGFQHGEEVVKEVPAKVKLRVGTFDSRAIAIAYARSEMFDQYLTSMREEYNKAKEEGNKELVKEFEEIGPATQQVMHQQAFSIASVAEILEKVKNELPMIAEEADVDIIVSKWDVVYEKPSIEIADVTLYLVKLFNPDEETLKTIEDLLKKPPMPLLEVLLSKEE